MRDLTIARRAALARIIAGCPDPALDRLGPALSTLPGVSASELRALLEQERINRRRRATAFAAVAPLFRRRADGVEALTFPAAVLDHAWSLASAREPAVLPYLDAGGPEADVVADRLCRSAAAAIRDRPDAIWPPDAAPGTDPHARTAALVELAACFDLAHLVRRALPSLPTWLDRPDGDRIAELRLLCRDAGAIAPDGAPRLVEMLFAHVSSAALILRVVTQTSVMAGREAFLRDSEMGVFVDRLIAAVRERARIIAGFRPGESDLGALRADIDWCAAVLGELDMTVQAAPTSPWGQSVREARLKVAARVSALLAQAEPAVERALPMERLQIVGRMTRRVPRLDADAHAPEVETARGLLGLLAAVRGAAAVFGCETDRAARARALEERLSVYADQALERVNHGDVTDGATALALIRVSADFLDVIEAGEAARVVRRRLAVAGRSASAA